MLSRGFGYGYGGSYLGIVIIEFETFVFMLYDAQ